ncbi:hypothetical protein ABZ442_30605 [Streptomyces triculaminicus]|uniref:hypothetical protein n=1 Tax=Streptomyces triculaminicus TaxID=2816232 RepID=UPI0033C7D538
MTILAHATGLLPARGAVQDISDVIADSFLLTKDITELKGLGVTVTITIEADAITAHVALDRRAANLLRPLATYIGAPGLTYLEPGTARAVGSMCEERIAVTITAPERPLAPAIPGERRRVA